MRNPVRPSSCVTPAGASRINGMILHTNTHICVPMEMSEITSLAVAKKRKIIDSLVYGGRRAVRIAGRVGEESKKRP